MNIRITETNMDRGKGEGLAALFNQHLGTGVGAEIGCAYGGHAEIILRAWKGTRLWMVDPWVDQPKEIYREATEDHFYDEWFAQVHGMMLKDCRISIIRDFSVNAAPLLADGSLDWVYIDGNHSDEATTEDLNAWYPKVRWGGIFCGHDFYDSDVSPYHVFTKRAVLRWMGENGYTEVEHTKCDGWVIYKK